MQQVQAVAEGQNDTDHNHQGEGEVYVTDTQHAKLEGTNHVNERIDLGHGGPQNRVTSEKTLPGRSGVSQNTTILISSKVLANTALMKSSSENNTEVRVTTSTTSIGLTKSCKKQRDRSR